MRFAKLIQENYDVHTLPYLTSTHLAHYLTLPYLTSTYLTHYLTLPYLNSPYALPYLTLPQLTLRITLPYALRHTCYLTPYVIPLTLRSMSYLLPYALCHTSYLTLPYLWRDIGGNGTEDRAWWEHLRTHDVNWLTNTDNMTTMAVKGRVTLMLTDNLARTIWQPCWPLKFKIWPHLLSPKWGRRYVKLLSNTDIGIPQ